MADEDIVIEESDWKMMSTRRALSYLRIELRTLPAFALSHVEEIGALKVICYRFDCVPLRTQKVLDGERGFSKMPSMVSLRLQFALEP